MERAQEHFSTVGLAHDVDTARDLLQQHQDMKKSTSSAVSVSVSVGEFFQSGSLEFMIICCDYDYVML